MRNVGGRMKMPMRASPPGSPEQGEYYFDTTLGYARIWNGTKWVPLGGLA